MSHRIGKVFISQPEPEDKCEACGTISELRPYGKDGARICFKCAMKDLETTKREFKKAIAGVDMVVAAPPADKVPGPKPYLPTLKDLTN